MLEYFTSSRGARKGLADTALRTADSGYLTRRLVDVSQDVIIREHDCGTHEGISVTADEEKEGGVQEFGDAIHGRFPAEDIADPATGEALFTRDDMLLSSDAEKLIARGVKDVRIRTVLDCESSSGVCARCYGINLATGTPVSIGEAVGVIAAQSIGEPGTQLTNADVPHGRHRRRRHHAGPPRVEELFEARKPKKMAILAEISGNVEVRRHGRTPLCHHITNHDDGEVRVYQSPYSAGIGSRLVIL